MNDEKNMRRCVVYALLSMLLVLPTPALAQQQDVIRVGG
jgi:hypothetical protein